MSTRHRFADPAKLGHRPVLIAFALLCVLCAAPRIASAVVIYDEFASSVDLPSDAHLTSLTLGVGANAINAKTSGSITGGDTDGFNFTVPANMQVTSGSLQVFFLTGPGSVTSNLYKGIVGDGGTVQLQSISVSTSSTGQFTTIPPAPLGPGLYSVFSFDPSTLATELPYTLTFNVAAIPEPTSFALIVMAGATMFGSRRARRSGKGARHLYCKAPPRVRCAAGLRGR